MIVMGDSIDPSTSAQGTLAVRPVGDEERAVPMDDKIGRLETVRIRLRAGSELDLFQWLERAAPEFGAIPHDRPAPLAEEQIPTE